MLAEKLRAATAAANAANLSWDLANAVYQGSPINFFSVATQEQNPTGVFFKPDGLKMYVTGTIGDDVNEYDLSTAWDISTAVFLQFRYVGAEDPTGVFFKPDGLKMYVVGYANDNVREYDLSTAWDISTAVFLQLKSIGAQETQPQGIFFKPDGLKMYVVGSAGDDVNEYDLSTAWDISTAVFLQLKSIFAQDSAPNEVFFKPDGSKMYVVGDAYNQVLEYDLSTAWDISTASYLQNFSVLANGIVQETSPQGIFFKPDGLKMYVVGASGKFVYEYDLSTAWDISTASFTSPTTDYFSIAAQEANPRECFFKPDGLKMYVVGDAGNDVNEYDLSTAWDISTAVFLQRFSVSAQESFPSGIFFKPDGLKMYVVGTAGDDVNEYDLSTAWDISTASYLQGFSVAPQEGNPRGIFFKPDGLKMYVVGDSGNDVNEYDLSTAWDVTTAVFLQLFSVSAQESQPTAVFFKPDGLKMYVVGLSGDDVNEYDVSTAWDISTASYLQNFSVSVQETSPVGVFFKPDGLKMYVVGGATNSIWSYDFV